MKFKLLLSCFLLLVVSLSPMAVDAQRENSPLTPVQQQGASLFKQRCGLCHLLTIVGKVNGQTAVMKGRLYGPRLTKDNVVGQEDSVRQQIMSGSVRMPGFQYGLTPAQISSIIEYLKTVEKPTEVGYSTGSADDDQ
jgi:mono/diheme cytochrome c family protein